MWLRLARWPTIKNVLVGFKIRPQAVAPKSTRPIVLEKPEFFYKKYPFNLEFARPMAIAELAQPKDAIALLKKSINSDKVAQTRAAILNALKSHGRKLTPK